MFSLLYVDDEPGLLEIGKLFLESTGDFEVTTVLSGKEGLAQITQQKFDAIVSDYQMPEMDGIEFLKAVRGTHGTIPFILFTGRGREEVVIEAINNGVDFYLQKGGDAKAQFAELAHKIRQSVTRRKAELALSESEKRLTDLIDFLPDATFAIDNGGQVIAWNRAMEEITGTPAAAIIGKGNYEYAVAFYGKRRPMLIDLVMQPDESFERSQYTYTLRSSTTLTAETVLEKEGKAAINLWGMASRLFNRQGDLIGAIESIRDITEMRKSEKALSDSEQRLADIINFLPDPTFAIDTERNVIAWNRAIEEMTGIPAADILGKGDFEYALPFYGVRRPILIDMILEPDENVAHYYSNILRDGNAIMAETNLPHPKGRQIYALAKASPLYNREGKITGAIEAIRDISDRKKNEEELLAANEQLAASGEELRAQYEELARSERRIRESEVRLSFIAGFYEHARKSERELLDFAIDGAGTVTGSPLAYLAFLSEDESELTMYAWSRSAMKECAMREKPIVYKTGETGLWGDAVRQRKAVITNNYEAQNPLKKGYPEGHPCVLRHMSIPVIDDGHIVLVAGVANKPTDYTESDTVDLELLMQALWSLLKQKRIEETRKESEARYHRVVDNSPAGMHFWELLPDDSFVLVGTNPSADTLLGVGHDDVIGKHPAEAFPALTQLETLQEFRRVAREGGIWQTELTVGEGPEIRSAFDITAFQITPGFIVTMFIDITRRKRAELDLRAAYERVASTEEELRSQYNELARAQGELVHRQEQLEEITATVPGVVYQFSVLPDGTRDLSFVNTKTAGTLFGLDSAEGDLIQQLTAHIHPDDRGQFERSIDEMVAQESDWSFEGRFIKPSGETIWFQGMSRPARHGNNLVYSGVFLDITSRKKIETALRESEERYRLITENSPEMIYFLDTKGYTRYVNTVAARMLNEDPTSLIGKPLSEILQPDAVQRFMDAIHLVTTSRTPLQREIFITLPSGTFWLDIRLVPLLDEAGTVLGVLGLSHDISDRKTAEEALRESETKYRMLVENSHDIIYTIRADGILTFASPSWTRFLGHDVRDVEGKPFQQFVHPADIPACEEFLARAAATRERSSEIEYRVFHADGSIRIHTTSLTPVFDQTGTLVAFVGDSRDITDLKQTQNAIRESNRKLNLLSSITRHDVANQLTVVQGYTQLAALRKPDPVTADFLAKIATAVDLIQHQIEFTRTYQDLGLQEPAWCPVGDVIRNVKPDELDLDCTCNACEIFADPMIGKVFYNLFDNAVRYGKTVTRVTVRCERAGDELVITFEDNGIGIPLNEKSRIFEKGFGQHTGFGLFLAREILAITGISIHETGSHGKGARFEITVPKGAFRSP